MNALRLKEYLSRIVNDAKLIVVSNREPCMHDLPGGTVQAVRPASGMITAIEPLVRAVNGTWIAHGAGSADRSVVDSVFKIGLPENRAGAALL